MILETEHLVIFPSNPIWRHDDRGLIRFSHHAWIEYQVSGKTNLLEPYTSGFIFSQLSEKQGIKKYGRKSELQLLEEFKQLMEYKTCHGRKSEDLTYDQKKKAANMIISQESSHKKTNRS